MSDIALITGTSSGIGLATAIALAKAGFQVVATLRDLKKREAIDKAAQAAGVKLAVAQLDVSDEASIQRCVKQVLQEHGRIDLLLNNAGAGYIGTLETTPHADCLRIMDVNFHGVWRTTQAVLPHMRAAKKGRILTISSVGGVLAQPFNEAYCAAKFAVEGLMESLAPVARRFNVHVSLIEPGAVASEFVQNANKPDPAKAMPEAYAAPFKAYMAASEKVFAAAQKPEEVAQVIVRAAQAEKPTLRYQTSPGISELLGKKLSDVTGEAGIALTGSRLG